jgi:hypothetical protein
MPICLSVKYIFGKRTSHLLFYREYGPYSLADTPQENFFFLIYITPAKGYNNHCIWKSVRSKVTLDIIDKTKQVSMEKINNLIL